MSTLSRIVRVLNASLGSNLTEADLAGVTRLDDVAALDSIAVLEFAIGLEREFALNFEPENMTRDFLVDLPQLIAYLERRRGTGRA